MGFKSLFLKGSAPPSTLPIPHTPGPYLEAEEAHRADYEVLSGGAGGRQHSRQVVDAQREEEDEAQQVAPDVDGLVGEDEEAARRHKAQGWGGEPGLSPTGPGRSSGSCPHLLRQRREGR